jgi:predicted Zn-dependent protease
MSNTRLQKLVEMLEKHPNDSFLNYALAMEYLGMNDAKMAESTFRRVLELDEENIAAKYQLAQLIQEEHTAEAILLLESGMKAAKQKGDMKTANEFRSLIDEIVF